MMTVFEKIPDYFVDRYNEELVLWGRYFAKIGPIKQIVLREGMLATLSPNAEQGRELLAVKLIARMERRGGTPRVTVEPLSEIDEFKIRRHCEKMVKARVPAHMHLIEPPRPWLPFMPTYERPKGNGR